MDEAPDTRLRGVLVAESIRPATKLADLAITVDAIARVQVDEPAPGQPGVWTLITFEVAESGAETLAAKLSKALQTGPWYVDFHGSVATFVVFSHMVIRYARGDADGRAAALAHGRAVGVPEQQLDWPH